MNERIQKLLEQCQIETYGVNGELLEIGFDAEKFAELIVRECSVALSPMLRDMVSRGQAYDLIKDHFGVEEWTNKLERYCLGVS